MMLHLFAVFRVFALMCALLAVRNDADARLRWDLASGIVAVTDDTHEQDLLASIARWESFYRADVVDCTTLGPQKERGAWQVLPRTPAERKRLCVSIEGDARIALGRVRESLTACASEKAEHRLSLYTRGSCTSREGQRLSKTRWVRSALEPAFAGPRFRDLPASDDRAVQGASVEVSP